MMKRRCLSYGWGLLLLLVTFGGRLWAAESAHPYPFNATGEMTWKTDSMTLLYRLDLNGHRPQDKVVGHLKVFDVRDTLQPLVDFSLKQLADPGEDEMQIAFMIPGEPGKAAAFFRKAQLVYDPWNEVFLFHPAYRSTPKEWDAYLAFPVDHFRLAAHLRSTSESELAAMQASAQEKAAAKAAEDQPSEKGAYAGDGTWKGNLRARDQLYKSSGFHIFWWCLLGIWAVYLVWLFPKARKAGQIIPLLLAAFCFLMVNFDGLYPFWAVMPGFMIAYPRLYSRVYPYSYVKVMRLFTWISVGVLVLLWGIFYQVWGWSSIRELVNWLLAGVLTWYLLTGHLGKSCCRKCGAYGRHQKLSEELVKREVRRSRIHSDTYDHTEVRSDEIVDWYKRKYGVRVEIIETFNVFYECRNCGQIFKNKEEKFKSKEKW